MTSTEMNAELFRQLSIIAKDESLMAKLLKYAKKLTANKKSDSSLMTEEEFFARVDSSMEQARQGRIHRIETKEELNQFLEQL